MSDLHKLTGAYAVDALDDLERARFEQHLDECDDCRFEVAELRETAGPAVVGVSRAVRSMHAAIMTGALSANS